MKYLVLTLAFLFTHVSHAEIHNASNIVLQQQIEELEERALSDEFYAGIRAIDLDGRYLPTGLSAEDEAILENKTIDSRFLYSTTYRWPMDQGVPDILMDRRFTYHLQPIATGVTVFPDIPPGSTAIDYIYIYQRATAATSYGGATTIADVPTTWRNATGAFRVLMERMDLTSAQQTGIVQGIEREILAGMSQAYTSTSTTARYIDFQSGSTGANIALDTTALVADGWTVVNANQLEKFISAGGATARRWRVLHN